MLEDDEWAVVRAAHACGADLAAAAALLDRAAAELGALPVRPPGAAAPPLARRLWALTAGYELFTGEPESNPNAVWHHVVSQYGPPCAQCGKPLRTPQAQLCAACGALGAKVRPPA